MYSYSTYFIEPTDSMEDNGKAREIVIGKKCAKIAKSKGYCENSEKEHLP